MMDLSWKIALSTALLAVGTVSGCDCGGSTHTADAAALNYDSGGQDGFSVDAGSVDVLGRDTRGQDVVGADAARTDAAGTDAAGTDAAGTDAAGTDAAGTDAAGTDAAGADAGGTDAAGADAAGTDAAGTDAAGTDAAGADAGGTDAAGTDAASADTTGADLTPVNQPPQVRITSPANSSRFSRGEAIRFVCEASDPEEGAVANERIVWRSDLEGGQIGIGATVQTGLAATGDHTITCTATDSLGLSNSASVTVTIAANFAPEAFIDSPADGAFFLASTPIAFVGHGVDVEDGNLPGSALRWIDGGAQIGLNSPLQTALTLGDHDITLVVTDSAGATGTVTITLHVVDNLPPVCRLTAPAPGATFFDGQSVSFRVTCDNPDGAAVANADIRWTSSLDGQVGLGAQVTNALVSVGDHTIEVCAKDPADATVITCERVVVHVALNQPPTVTITDPAAGVIPACQAVDLRCNGDDPEGGNLSYVWSSSLEGELAQTRRFTWNPSVSGGHVLTCAATDPGGKVGEASVTVDITSPAATISRPVDGEIHRPGGTVTFAGQGCDTEDGVLGGGALAWTSDVDGALGSGNFFTRSDLSTGRHLITLTATDGDGNQGTHSVTLWINTAPTVSITAPADGSSYLSSDTVTFSATSADAEDPAPPAITWSDNLAGELGTGDSASFSGFAIGVHLITASVTDSSGERASDSVRITVDDGSALFDRVAVASMAQSLVTDPNSGGSWIGTQDGLYFLDGTNPPQLFNQGNSDLPSNDVNAVLVLTDSTLLVGTGDGLAVCASPGAGQTGSPTDCTVLTDNNGPLPFDSANMTALLQLPDGRVLVGTRQCLVFWDPVASVGRRYCQGDGGGDGLVGDQINALTFDASTGQIWVATDRGASLMTPSVAGVTDRDAQDFQDYRRWDGLAGSSVRAIAVAPSGLVWFACDGGLSVLDRGFTPERITSYTAADGLPSNNVRDVAIDVVEIGGVVREVAWAAALGGLGRVDHAIPSVMAITTSDGLSSNDCRSVFVGADHVKVIGLAGGADTYWGL